VYFKSMDMKATNLVILFTIFKEMEVFPF